MWEPEFDVRQEAITECRERTGDEICTILCVVWLLLLVCVLRLIRRWRRLCICYQVCVCVCVRACHTWVLHNNGLAEGHCTDESPGALLLEHNDKHVIGDTLLERRSSHCGWSAPAFNTKTAFVS